MERRNINLNDKINELKTDLEVEKAENALKEELVEKLRTSETSLKEHNFRYRAQNETL